MPKRTITSYFAGFTFLLAAVALQLYYNKDYYFAMNRAKCSFTMIVLIGAALTFIVGGVEHHFRKHKFVKQRMTLLDWSVLVFGVSSLVTCVLAKDPVFAFVGTKGMFVGGFTYMTGMLMYFVVSRNMVANKLNIGILLAGWGLIFLWTVMNQCGVDYHGMHENMKPGDVPGYVASMGNSNSASDAFAGILGLCGIFAVYNRKFSRLICAVGVIAVMSIGNEGVLIGLVAMMTFVLFLLSRSNEQFGNGLKLILCFGIGITLYHILGIAGVIHYTGMASKIAGYYAGEIFVLLSASIYNLSQNGNLSFDEQKLRKLGKYTAIAFASVICVFMIVALIKSTYDPDFGNTRGAIWKGSIWSFRLYSPIEMIFGQGSGMFADNVTLAFTMLFGEESSPVTYATCHNSLLQALLGQGIIGLACLLLGLYSLIRDWFKMDLEKENPMRIASLTAIMGYFGASLVESTYPHTVILLFAMLALYRNSFTVPRK